jgi:uncharacterized protein YggE
MATKPMHLDPVSVAAAIDAAVAAADEVTPTAAGANLTDSTGGTPSSTLPAGITDANAKNAIASLNARLNAVVAALKTAGVLT